MISQKIMKSFQITEGFSFNKKTLKDELIKNHWVSNLWPVIYIISNKKQKKAYIGESVNALSRIQNHLTNINRNKLDTLHIITSDHFNKSATLNIESNLIKYFPSDTQFVLQNGNLGITHHNFYEKEDYDMLFVEIWEQLKQKELVLHSLEEINNSNLFKYSPYKSLNNEQHNIILELLSSLLFNKSTSIIINGIAGTGKTILAIYLIKALSNDNIGFDIEISNENLKKEVSLIKDFKEKYKNPKIALVIPMPGLRGTIKKVFKNIKGLSANMVISPSEVAKNEYDLLIVDESHRLKRRLALSQFGIFDKNNTLLKLDKNKGTELDWILLKSKHQIFFYDSSQSIKPSDINKERFDTLINESKVIPLLTQMRVKGGEEYINYVDKLLNCNIGKNDKIVNFNEYDFKIFDSFVSLKNELTEKENQFKLCRFIAGYSWKWKSKKNPKLFDIEIENIGYKWNNNKNFKDWINSKKAFDEIGCIHTTQGYDLNYTGLIFGNEISYDPLKKEIFVIKENYHDTKGKEKLSSEELKKYIINIYKTLMYRGIRGTYIYVCDDNLRKYFKEFIPLFQSSSN
jgi:DUF2075 family protein/predicted GIY-YIG superfamily endonuclease